MSNVFQITIRATDKATATIRKVNDSMSRITRPFEQVGKSFKSLGREIGFNKISQDLAKVGNVARDAARHVGNIVAPMAALTGIASVGGIIALADGWAKLGRNITYSAQNIGIGTTQLQEYESAARLAGIGNGVMTQSLNQLGDTMEDALYGRNQQALMLFNRLGIGIKRTRDGAMDAAGEFKALAGAIYKLPNAQVQNLAARQFGLTALLPLIRQGPAALDKLIKKAHQLGMIMTPQQIAAANEFAGKLAEMDSAATGLKNSIGNALIPAIEPLIMQLTAWVSKNKELIGSKVGEWARNVGHWIQSINWKQVGSDIHDFVGDVNSVVQALGGWKNVMIGTGIVMGANFLKPLISVTGWVAKIGVFAVSATTGITGLAAAFAALGVAIAAATGAIAGYWIYTHYLQGTKAGDAIGEGAAQLAANLGIPGAQQALNDMHHRGPANHSGDFHPERTAAGKAKLSQAMQFFMSKGWTKAQAAGIVANIARETGNTFNPAIVGDKGTAFGLGQWHKDRQAAFAKFAGHSIVGSTMAEQLAFYNYELSHGEKKAGDMLHRAKNPFSAGAVVSLYDERPADAQGEMMNRGGQAQQIFDTYQAPTGPYSQQVAGKGAPQEVHVTVSAEPGTKATVKPSPNVTASTRVAHSAVGAAA